MAVVTWTSVWGAYLGTDPPVGETYTITLYADDGKTILGVEHVPELRGEIRFEVYGQRAGSLTIEQEDRQWFERITPPRVGPGEAYAVVVNFDRGNWV